MNRRIQLTLGVACAAVLAGAWRSAPVLDELLNTRVVPWSELKSTSGPDGTVRTYFSAPTSTLLRIGLRARTLEPGATPNPTLPYSTPQEQLLIVKEGTLEVKLDEKVQRVSAGDAVFLAPNQWHALRNPGTAPVTYYQLDWVSPGMNGEREY
jgi:mannose-6-phosphate isomerase-like protein (cupin superfamily)